MSRPNYKSFELNYIKEVIQKDFCTTIIDHSGRKCIVECSEENFDSKKEIMKCLLKYLIPPSRYSAIMKLNPTIETIYAILISWLGFKELDIFLSEC